MKTMIFCVSTAALLIACSEGGNGTTSGSGGDTSVTTTVTSSATGTTSTATGSTSTASSTSTGTTSTSTGTGGGKTGSIVVNEISGKGDDWVELGNPTGAAIDVSGWIVCDQDANKMCDKTNAVTFPPGTSIPAFGYVLIVGKEPADGGVGPHAMCLAMGGPTMCFWASWGISDSSGDSVFVHDENDMPITEGDYPMNATMSGQTYCRLPDMTGNFAVCKPTPGAANAAP